MGQHLEKWAIENDLQSARVLNTISNSDLTIKSGLVLRCGRDDGKPKDPWNGKHILDAARRPSR